MYISENSQAPQLGGFLDTITGLVNWGADTYSKVAAAVSPTKTSQTSGTSPKPTTAPAPTTTAPRPAVTAAQVATGMKIGLPVILLGGVAAYFLLRKK